jgi:hypothetical protein
MNRSAALHGDSIVGGAADHLSSMSVKFCTNVTRTPRDSINAKPSKMMTARVADGKIVVYGWAAGVHA